MATGIYGTTKASDVRIEDISMYYNFTPNRETINTTIYPLVPADLLSYTYMPSTDVAYVPNTENLLEGLYNMKLPATIFNQLGIYTIYIKPKTIKTTIKDCGVLSALPTVKGLLLNISDLPSELTSNNALQGYRIEYINSDGTKLRNVSRYIVSSNKVVPVSESVGNTSQRATRYRFDDAGSLLFLQITPSSSSDVKPNTLPFIGNADQTILISNTFFTPMAIEVEMVENTIDTVAEFIAGEQVKDVKKGILTNYDKSRVITNQYNLFEIKDDVTDVPLFEVREKRTNIDVSQDFNLVINSTT